MEEAIFIKEKGKKTLKILGILFSCLLLQFFIMNADIYKMQDFSIVVVGIIIQAIPFLLLGTIISSIIRVYISDEVIVKLFPRTGALSMFSAIGIGFLLPLCDCAVIPVAVRLKKKGVPIHAIITFIMAAPIVNPVVIASTIYAFPGTRLFMYRIIVGIIIAVMTGIFMKLLYPDEKSILNENNKEKSCTCCHHGHNSSKKKRKLIDAIVHSGEEFIDVSKLFILGVFITALISVFISKDTITSFAGGTASSIIIMMLTSFTMSICATSDSFIAKGFATNVTTSGVFAFIVFGPSLDLKNAIMMAGFFKKRFVVKFVTVAFIVAFSIISISSVILFG